MKLMGLMRIKSLEVLEVCFGLNWSLHGLVYCYALKSAISRLFACGVSGTVWSFLSGAAALLPPVWLGLVALMGLIAESCRAVCERRRNWSFADLVSLSCFGLRLNMAFWPCSKVV